MLATSLILVFEYSPCTIDMAKIIEFTLTASHESILFLSIMICWYSSKCENKNESYCLKHVFHCSSAHGFVPCARPINCCILFCVLRLLLSPFPLVLHHWTNIGPEIGLFRVLHLEVLGKSFGINIPAILNIPVGILPGISASRIVKGSSSNLSSREWIVSVRQISNFLCGIVGDIRGAAHKSNATQQPHSGPIGACRLLVCLLVSTRRRRWLDVTQKLPTDLGGKLLEGIGRHGCCNCCNRSVEGDALVVRGTTSETVCVDEQNGTDEWVLSWF